MMRMLRIEPAAGDTYALPSGSVVTVLLVSRNELIICHYLMPDGRKQRGKAAEVVFTADFLMAHCKRKNR